MNTKYFTLNANTMSCVQMFWLATLWVVNECQLFTFWCDYNQDSNHLIKGVKKSPQIQSGIFIQRKSDYL
jgi:hypothetical protein